jgi:O-antigen biosynthesis protein
MIISVFTPTNDTSWLREAWESLRDQTVDFEWLIGLNGKPNLENIPDDPRIRRVDLGEWRGVGAAKRELCEAALGEVFLELDHDDILAGGALASVRKAFEDPEIGFVFSDTAEWDDSNGMPFTYSPEYGWSSYPCVIRGRSLLATNSRPVNARNLCQILYAPNHLRAWRRKAYFDAGGHNPELRVADDMDLMCRTYLVTKMYHIPEALYGYRRRSDSGNTWLKHNTEIQVLCGQGADLKIPAEGQPMALRDKYFHKMIKRECELRSLPMIDIGGGIFGERGWTTLDVSGQPDITWDVFGSKRLPFEDGSVGAFRAYDFLEHGEDTDAFWLMDEIHRCLAPGGYFLSYTPHALGIGASCDPSHKSRWDERRFLYWCSEELRPFLKSAYPQATAKFKPVRLYRENRVMGPHPWKFEVPYVVADLMKE